MQRSHKIFLLATILSLLLLGWMGSTLAAVVHRDGILPSAQSTGTMHHHTAQGSTMDVTSLRHQTCNHGTCSLLGCCVVADNNDPDNPARPISARPFSVFATATEFIALSELKPPIYLL